MVKIYNFFRNKQNKSLNFFKIKVFYCFCIHDGDTHRHGLTLPLRHPHHQRWGSSPYNSRGKDAKQYWLPWLY